MIRLGIATALWAEARCLAQQVSAAGQVRAVGEEVLLCICGMGEERAGQAAQDLLAAGAGALLSWGFAGALDERLKAGELLLPGNIISRDGRRLPTDPAWRQRLHRQLSPHLSIHTGDLADSDSIISGTEQRRQLRQQSDAAAVDMESAAIAIRAERAGVPFMAVRAVSDDGATAIPEIAVRAVDPYGRLHCSGLMRILGQPQCWSALWRLGRDTRAAAMALKKATRLTGPGLCLQCHD